MRTNHSFPDVHVHELLRSVPNLLHSDFRVVLWAKLPSQEVHIHPSLEQQMYQQEEEVSPEDEGQKGVEDGSERDQVDVGGVFGGEVQQAEKHEHLHGLREVEMHTNVLPFEGLAVDGEAEVGSVHGRNPHDGSDWRIVGSSKDECDQHLLDAAEEPEVLGDGLVVSAHEVDSRRKGMVAHPLRLDHLLLRFQQQQDQQRHLQCQEQGGAEGTGRGEGRTEGEVGDLREDVDVDLDQREVEEDDQEVEPQDVVKTIHEPINADLPIVPTATLYLVPLPLSPAHLRLAHIVHALPRGTVQLPLYYLVLLAFLEPLAHVLHDHREREDREKDQNPRELIGKEICSFSKDTVLAKDILGISGGDRVVRGDVEERPHGDIFKGVGADIEAVERGEEDVELLREVEVDEDDQGEFLHVLDGLVKKVLHALHEDREGRQHQRRNDESQDQALIARVERGRRLAHARTVLVGVGTAVAHPVDGRTVVAAIHAAGAAGEVVLRGAGETTVVAGLPDGQAHQQENYYQFHYHRHSQSPQYSATSAPS